MATKYECDKCGKTIVDRNKLKTVKLFDFDYDSSVQPSKCWDFQITDKDICEQCARQLGEFLKKQPEIKLV